MACGEIGLSPSEFYALQFSELKLILKGYQERIEREQRERRMERAWAMCWLLLPHTAADADKITPDQLVGDKGDKLIFPALKPRKTRRTGPAMTKEQARARGAELFAVHQKVFGGRA